jgi:hypothetical protein
MRVVGSAPVPRAPRKESPIPLAGFEPGDYELALRVGDEVSRDERTVSEPFTVVPSGGLMPRP